MQLLLSRVSGRVLAATPVAAGRATAPGAKFCTGSARRSLAVRARKADAACTSSTEQQQHLQRAVISEASTSTSGFSASGLQTAMLMAAAAATPLLLDVESAMAIGREYGIVEGRIFSLMHPVAMGSLFLASLWAAYLGLSWREVRTIPATIKDLKAQLPAADAEGNVPPSEAGTKIAELEAVRGAWP